MAELAWVWRNSPGYGGTRLRVEELACEIVCLLQCDCIYTSEDTRLPSARVYRHMGRKRPPGRLGVISGEKVKQYGRLGVISGEKVKQYGRLGVISGETVKQPGRLGAVTGGAIPPGRLEAMRAEGSKGFAAGMQPEAIRHLTVNNRTTEKKGTFS